MTSVYNASSGGTTAATTTIPGSTMASSSLTIETESAVPTLKVMRLQKPELHMSTCGTLDGTKCLLGNALCLPDSFGVIYVGETFTAYLGALNVSKTMSVYSLTVSAQLQTPSQRWHLASRLDEGNSLGGVNVPPGGAIDAIVSHALEEAGQHILRVEVGYRGNDGSPQSIRKFYRFQVSNPLVLSEWTYRINDQSCYVSFSVENRGTEGLKSCGLTIGSADIDPSPGLVVEKIDCDSSNSISTTSTTTHSQEPATATGGSNRVANYCLPSRKLFDASGRLEAGESKRYLFKVSMIPSSGDNSNTTTTTTTMSSSRNSQTTTANSTAVRGIASGDELGKAIFTWRKACGEMGRMASSTIVCPAIYPIIDPNNAEVTMKGIGSDYVVHSSSRSSSITDGPITQGSGGGSGLSIDVANSAAAKVAAVTTNPNMFVPNMMEQQQRTTLDMLLPVTVEPINPPQTVQLGIPCPITFLIVNHSDQYRNVQLQFRLEHMDRGISVCGPSFQNVEEIASDGGSTTIQVRFLPLCTGLIKLTGCCIVDLASGLAIPQPPLLNILVVED